MDQSPGSEISLGSLRPPTPLQINEVPPSSSASGRVHSLSEKGANNNLQIKRKSYNHALRRFDKGCEAFKEARETYHQGGRLSVDHSNVRYLYGKIEDLRRELCRVACEYLSAENETCRPERKLSLERDFSVATEAAKVAYLAIRQDRVDQYLASRVQPPMDLRSAMSTAMNKQLRLINTSNERNFRRQSSACVSC